MTFPTGLFVDAPEMADASMHQLSEDTATWPEELTMKLKERIPAAANMSIIVKFMKKDEEVGTATGSLIVSNNETQVVIPIIIKDYMLSPLDVFIAKGKLLPLNQEYFGSVFNEQQQPFQNLEEYPNYGGLGRFDDGNLWNMVYPPSLGRYAYASAGTYPVINDISETIKPEDVKETLTKDAAAWAKLALRDKELVQKIAHLQSVNMNEFRQSKDNLLQRNIYLLKNEGPHKATILANYDDVFSPVLKRVDSYEDYYKFKTSICDKVSDDLNDVDINGEKFVYIPSRKELDAGALADGPYLEQPVSHPVEIAKEYDHYIVKKRDGVEVEGVVIPTVIDFDMNVTESKIFIGKTMSTVQPEIAGVRLKNSRFQLPCKDIQPGQTGTLVYQKNPSKALATVPFTVVSYIDGLGKKVIKAQDLMGVGFKIELTDTHLEKIVRTPGTSTYLVPCKMFRWVPMEGFNEISNSTLDWAAKTAGVDVIHTGHSRYSIKGVDKYAQVLNWDMTNLSRGQTMFMLTSLGIPKTAAEKCLTKISSGGVMREKVAVKAVPFAKEEKIHPIYEKIAAKFKSNLVKAANYVENSQSVDALLSLNFINPENVQKFVSKIPSFKSAISNLASLLIASRIGVKELPEDAINTAMNRLVEVVNGLETLRATQEQK